jgi:hypothetical protein
MNWLWVIIVVAVIGAVLAYMGEKNKDEKANAAVSGAITGGLGCGYLILQILLGLAGLWILIEIGRWLFS